MGCDNDDDDELDLKKNNLDNGKIDNNEFEVNNQDQQIE